MCGIVGFWTIEELPIEPELAYEAIYSAFRKQQSRGTDSFGLFLYRKFLLSKTHFFRNGIQKARRKP